MTSIPPSEPSQGPECDEALHQLYVFLDGELTQERRELIRHHLDECIPCLGAFDFEAELRVVMAQKCRDSVPTSLRQRIADAIAADGGGVPL
ncbi:MAG TPA: mycothiol system anti-sigma-R factor [Acidimicrobiales bacterium]|jgi:mycothiol system anti-sigma-R factor